MVLILFGAIPVLQAVPSAQTRSAPAATSELRIQTLSNRPDLLSGGNALVRVDVPAGVALSDVRVTLENRDVTAAFRADVAAHAVVGLVSGLGNGSNVLAVTTAAADGPAPARLVLTNYPIAGPVFSGPHEQPFICETQNFKLRSGGTLGPPLDNACSIATRVDYVYRSTSGGALKPLADPQRPPDDVAQATTSPGRMVPYVVRIETGTINRAIYQIAVLHDPAHEAEPDFLTPPAAWNRRLIYTFGGGCNGGWYRQAITTGGVEDDLMLRNGYAVASASLTVAGNNCNQVLSAETMMMVKERFIEAYGPPAFTIGYGASGGAYQQHVIADAYPGLLDGIMPLLSFPDVMHALTTTSADSLLLDHYFAFGSALPYTEEQMRAISGYVSVVNMLEASRVRARRINPTATCPEVLPSTLRYDPVNNPKGARCDIYDHAVNILGRDGQTGVARRPLDNAGIQYGLAALNAGTITAAQFLDLNERIGGFDIDANFAPYRNVADLDALRALYRSGLLTSGGAGLSTIPIIDHRAYLDEQPKGDPHLRYHSFSMRARLMKANGHADNHVILVDPATQRVATSSPAFQEALSHMDQWLTTLSQDVSSDAPVVKMRRARPAGLVDACWTRDASYRKIAEPQVYGSGECERLYPSASYPRGVAGESIAADVVKCQLKPIDPRDYTVAFTPDEKTRLETIFPGGVCDWTKPGVGQDETVKTWQRYDTPRPVSSR
jgi:hypothetical protein